MQRKTSKRICLSRLWTLLFFHGAMDTRNKHTGSQNEGGQFRYGSQRSPKNGNVTRGQVRVVVNH